MPEAFAILCQGVHGARRGSFCIDDDKLFAALEKESVESCRWSLKHGRAVRTLTGSKRQVWKRLPEIHEQIGYVQFTNRLKGCRLGVETARNRCDLCAVCNSWDTHHQKQVVHDYDDAKRSLEASCGGYWTDFMPPLVEDAHCSAVYLHAFLAFIHSHSDRCSPVCDAVRVGDVVTETFLRVWTPIIDVFSFHFMLRDFVRNAFSKDWEQPTAGWTYIVMDFQVS